MFNLGRAQNPDTLVIITDGYSSNAQAAANVAKNAGIKIIAVGVGNNVNIQHLVAAHNINYYAACSEESLEETLPKFYNEQENKRPAVLEIFTPKEANAVVLKSYFEAIKDIPD